jgi:H+-translocating NAD(P) transhydrogenase subunit beta
MSQYFYIFAAFFFIFGMKKMGSPVSARKGNFLSSIGMFMAIATAILSQDLINPEYLVLGLLLGTVIGLLSARLIGMTSMPEMVALLNGCGGLASLLVGFGVFFLERDVGTFLSATILLSVLIGGITTTGSLIAWAKLKEVMTSKPIIFKGQHFLNLILLIGMIGVSAMFCLDPVTSKNGIFIVLLISLILGITTAIPIGGADMPVVVSLLNSYSGLAACAVGFVVQNTLLIVAGSLVGASGIILTQIMCRAMNRSITNVLVGGFGATVTGSSDNFGEPKPISAEDVFLQLEASNSVLVVPGYGLAVAQAQHTVRELAEFLTGNGCEVRYAIHPVAGRMPGHMNVLLAEADISYDALVEMDDINKQMETIDMCIVIGANDIVNPGARDDKTSSIYGMPIIEVDRAKSVIVLKRGMGSGFAGIQNPLFFKENTRMLFGNAKTTLQELVNETKDFAA